MLPLQRSITLGRQPDHLPTTQDIAATKRRSAARDYQRLRRGAGHSGPLAARCCCVTASLYKDAIARRDGA